jgi:hypothetical protein
MKTTLTLTICLLLSLAAVAQVDSNLPKPGPEQKKIDYFAGSWTLDGDTKASAMGPAGKVTETEKCEWLEGGFFLVCHTDYTSNTMGNGKGLSILGFSSDAKAYTFREFNSWGEFEDSKGQNDGDTWTWTADEKMGDTSFKGKFTMKITSPTTYNFTYEMSPDGAKWNTIMDGKATKAK